MLLSCFLSCIVISTDRTQAQLDTAGFPLEIGNRWYYSYTNRTTPSPVIRVKTITQIVGPGAYMVREMTAGQDQATVGTEIWIVTNGSFYDSVAYVRPECLYNASLLKDTSWYYVQYGSYQGSILLDTVSLFHSQTRCQIRSTYTVVTGGWRSDENRVALGVGWYYHYDDGFYYESGYTNVYHLVGLLTSTGIYGDTSLILADIGRGYELFQNYPNPFNSGTTIGYTLPTPSVVRLTVYDILGRKISVLVNETKNAGPHEVRFDAGRLTSGVYFYRLEAGNFTQTKRLLILR